MFSSSTPSRRAQIRPRCHHHTVRSPPHPPLTYLPLMPQRKGATAIDLAPRNEATTNFQGQSSVGTTSVSNSAATREDGPQVATAAEKQFEGARRYMLPEFKAMGVGTQKSDGCDS
ncbi:hypothetical protein Salat_2705300 [Sesamum alatum]|uniref:Uncharacterized protein n=1 Tax=Sesamum alatum TaxID=300844 RepID=A0AAE1XQW5_9LAMI|nr:hypothetical protein Salat_2705300 [Sesamum alatum]